MTSLAPGGDGASLLERSDGASLGHPGDAGARRSLVVGELFAGVGGFRCALEPLGYRFAWANQWEPGKREQHAASVYQRHFGPGSVIVRDVRQLDFEIKGWALSCSTDSLGVLLPMCAELGVKPRIATWVKPGGVPRETFGMHSRQEHVLVVGGRRCQPGIRDWLMAHPARGGGDLPGRKPIAFCAWLFDLLGMIPGDALDDLFPGTGIVGRAWVMMCTGVVRSQPVEPGKRVVLQSVAAQLVDEPFEELEASLAAEEDEESPTSRDGGGSP